MLLATLGASGQTLPEPGPLIAEILPRHPVVRRAESLLSAARAELDGNGLQPNPTLTLAVTAGDAGEDSNALTQTFEISGQPRLRLEQAEARERAARFRLQAARREVARIVCQDWLALWESQHLAMIAQLRVALMNDMVRVARRRYEVGEIPQNEALRVELAAAEAEADWRRAEADFHGAERSLAILRGLVEAEPAALALQTLTVGSQTMDQIFDGPKLSPEEAPWTLEQVLASAEQHLEVLALREEQKASLRAAELLGKERAPQLGLSLYRSEIFASVIEQGAQLSLSWPLFDWGSINSRRRAREWEAQAQLEEAEERALERRREVAGLWNDWQGARAVREILQGQARRYEELAREARIGYDLGMLTLTDVLQTESAFREAGVELIGAHAEVYRLELGLLGATNLPWPAELLEEIP
jgi:outer membrane protein TolC